jgi:hypothetical protein
MSYVARFGALIPSSAPPPPPDRTRAQLRDLMNQLGRPPPTPPPPPPPPPVVVLTVSVGRFAARRIPIIAGLAILYGIASRIIDAALRSGDDKVGARAVIPVEPEIVSQARDGA